MIDIDRFDAMREMADRTTDEWLDNAMDKLMRPKINRERVAAFVQMSDEEKKLLPKTERDELNRLVKEFK